MTRRFIGILSLMLLGSLPAPNTSAREPIIFPKPKKMELAGGGTFKISPATQIVIRAGADEREQAAVREIVELVFNDSGKRLRGQNGSPEHGKEPVILIGEPSNHPALERKLQEHKIDFNAERPGPEGYVLLVTPDCICIAGSDPDGTFWGIQTLLEIMRQQPAQDIPAMKITDYPDIKYRGLFNEDCSTTDRMTLDDYKKLIDFMAAHKMNSLAVGIYGCWGDTDKLSYRGGLAEFFMVPVPQLPKLVSPQTVEYYSPRESAWKEISYVPTMFEQDLFGKIIEYGKTRHVNVHPKFNSLGHNTLIPRMYPEVSAVDGQGRPIEYSFSTMNEKTYELLFTIYDHIIDTYLIPNGIYQFDIQLDEARSWCARDMEQFGSHEAIFKHHLLKIAKHLKAKGMRHIGMWDDMLGRNLDGINHIDAEFAALLREEGLDDVLVIQWWWYRPIAERQEKYSHDGFRSELGLRNWVVPMTGLKFTYQFRYGFPHLVNVFEMLAHGKTQQIEGAESYHAHEPRHHINDTALADFSWNLPDPDERWKIDEHLKRYARYYFGPRWQEAHETLLRMQEFYTAYSKVPMSPLTYGLYSRTKKPYLHMRPYPEEAFKLLRRNADSRDKLVAAANEAAPIRGFLRDALDVQGADQHVVRPLYANFARIHNLARAFLLLYEVDDLYAALRKTKNPTPARLQEIGGRLLEIKTLQLEALELWERHQPEFLHHGEMRDMSFMLHFVDERLGQLAQWRQALDSGATQLALPEKFITGTIHEL